MKRIALLHTVKSVLLTFEDRIRAALPDEELSIVNTLDEFLAADTLERGSFSKTNMDRLYSLLRAAAQTGADVVCVTCSTLTPFIGPLRSFFVVPLIAIDDAMCRAAASMGPRVHVLASSPTTISGTLRKIEEEAALAGVSVTLTHEVCAEAFAALSRGDRDRHDELFRDVAHYISDKDAIVLAQASMAHLRNELEALRGIPVLSSPELCVEEIVHALGFL